MSVPAFRPKGPVFFLFPQSIEQEQIVKLMVYYEIEAYLLRDPNIAIDVLRQYPESTICINIDASYNDAEWKDYILRLTGDADLAAVDVILLGFKSNSPVKAMFCDGENPSCGFVQLRANQSPLQEILAQFETVGANERRKTIRLKFNGKKWASLKLIQDEKQFEGKIEDLSTAGMVCSFQDDTVLQKGTQIENIQIARQNISLELAGQVAGHTKSTGEHNGSRRHVILFRDSGSDWNKKLLCELMYSGLQNKISETIKKIEMQRRV